MQGMAYRQYISESTVNYLMQQFPSRTVQWMYEFDAQVRALLDKWQLTLNGHENTSRFGAILYARSEIYGDVALKIIPWFSPRLKSEIACYRTLPYREMCPVYDTEESVGALLLKYLPAQKDSEALSRRRETLFASLYAQRRLASQNDASILPRYEDVLESVMQNAWRQVNRLQDESISPLMNCIARAGEAISMFAKSERYVIHGDAHEYNMLANGESCALIDPLGFIAPFAFEYARYIGTATRQKPLSPDALSALVTRILPQAENRDEALRAFAIDTTLRACNTFIEGNTYNEIRLSVDWACRAWQSADLLCRR